MWYGMLQINLHMKIVDLYKRLEQIRHQAVCISVCLRGGGRGGIRLLKLQRSRGMTSLHQNCRSGVNYRNENLEKVWNLLWNKYF